ncbi:transporter substrate-binding domain-containing protein (plasmid) [Mesorhizobium sp. ORM8.1]
MEPVKSLLIAAYLVVASTSLALALPNSITIGTEGAYPPWNFTEAGGKLNGFEIDLAAELCKRMKVQCTMVAQDWNGLIPGLFAKKFDAVMSGIKPTPKRREIMAFSRDYGGFPNGFAALSSGPLGQMNSSGKRFDLNGNDGVAAKQIETLRQLLKGKTIGVQVATINEEFLKKYFAEFSIRSYTRAEESYLDLLSGRVDAVFSSTGAHRAAFVNPEFRDYAPVGPLFFGGDILGGGGSIGLRKEDTELRVAFDEAINSMINDGTLRELSVKWFKEDITPQR